MRENSICQKSKKFLQTQECCITLRRSPRRRDVAFLPLLRPPSHLSPPRPTPKFNTCMSKRELEEHSDWHVRISNFTSMPRLCFLRETQLNKILTRINSVEVPNVWKVSLFQNKRGLRGKCSRVQFQLLVFAHKPKLPIGRQEILLFQSSGVFYNEVQEVQSANERCKTRK